MSQLVDTSIGTFRCVEDSGVKRFLYRCLECNEWLPMDEETFAGRKMVVHESLKFPASYCKFTGPVEFGVALISTMQAAILMGEKPYRDEWETPMVGYAANSKPEQEEGP